jgi:protein ImuB
MRRCLSLQLTNLPIDRLRLKGRRRGTALPEPFALYAEGPHGEVIHAVDAAAAALGVVPGLRLADARAMLPGLALAPAALAAERRFLEGLAKACLRYTPAVALAGDAALVLDITGCAHLLGGEAALLDDLRTRLDRQGLAHRLAIADGQAAAWAWARYGEGGVLKGEAARPALLALSVRALRLDAAVTEALERLGLRHLDQLQALPQQAIVRRFGREPVLALGRLLGHEPEPFEPLRPPPRFAARLSWPEPIGRTEDVQAAIHDLLQRLQGELERAVAGARRIELLLFRVDGEVVTITVRAGRPSRDAAHFDKLFALQLDGLDIGFGIEAMRLEVTEVAPLRPEQADLAQSQDAAELARLVDQLRLRLGDGAVVRLMPVQSHWPEHAVAAVDPMTAPPGSGGWLATQPRPLRLLDRPVAIEAVAPVPDGPPVLLRRYGRGERVRAASGPERIEPEWWRLDGELARPRDYYRTVDEAGRILWLYREGRYGDPRAPGWFVHGTCE